MLQPKKSNKRPSPNKKYNTSKPKTQDSLAEDVFEIFDPTGISSYDDVYRSYKKNGLFSLETGLEVLGALPVIGKAGKGLKAIRTANKYIKGLNKVNKVVAKAEKVVPAVLKQGKNVGRTIQRASRGGRANPVGVASMGVGMGAEAFQKLNKVIEKGTGKVLDKVIAKAPGKKVAITTAAATLNTTNTLSDVAGAVQGQLPKKQESTKTGKPKIVYYNTDSKRGKVEKPGDEEGVQYVPVSNSVQLEKWKAQNNVPVASDLKTKVTREVLGTLMPDQAAQFLTAIATKDNKLGLEDLTPDIQEALIKSVKNAQKRTGKDSGGTQYIDYSPEVEQAFQGMSAGKKQMVSTDPDVQAATMLGRVSYKKNALGETEIYDSYDFSKTDPKKADTFYKKVRAYAGAALPDDGKKPNLIGKIPAEEELAYGTNLQGIMKNKMNPRKKYANGSDAKGMDPNHYIISPAEALNDYNIMLAKVEAEANSNPWLPIVAMAGQAMQTGIGIAGKASVAKAATGVNDPNSPNYVPKAAMGNNNLQQDVEVEGGEMYETPQGQVGEFQGPSHEQGGIPLEVGQDVEEGTKVYSDRLKVGKKTLAERKATREKQVANLEKIASNNLADQAVKNAAKRKMMAIEREEAADLDFQDKVNNMQAMADTMVEAFACGTGMGGIQKMDAGGVVGNPPDWRFYNYDANGNYTGPALPQPEIINPTDRLSNANKALEDYLSSDAHKKAGSALDSIITKTDADTKAMTETGTLPSMVPASTPSPIVNTGKTGAPGFVEGFGMDVDQTEQGMQSPQAGSNFEFNPIDIPALNLKTPNILDSTLAAFKPKDSFAMTAGEDWAKANPLPEGVQAPIPDSIGFTPASGVAATDGTENKTEPSKFMKALEGNMPAVGDMTKLIGNYLGMTSGIKTAAEQRSTDVTHTNVYANAGKESQKLLDNAKQGIQVSKAQAVVKATDVARGGKRGARGSARGVNQMRAMDWLYDTALQGQIAEISAKAAEQMSGIDVQKSGVAMSADQLKGQGEYQANMANEAAKDAYYTALGMGRKDFATGLQQTGKDLNDMKENKIIEGLMKQYGTYFTGDKSGVKAKTFKEITGEEQVVTDAEGNQYKVGKDGKLTKITKTK